jgi:hypothetical protein
MSRYRTIDIRMHGDEVIASLSRPQPNARSLWDHLLYGPSTGIVPGLYRAREAQLADELEWSLEPFREAFRELSTARFRLGLSGYLVKADWRAGLVWVPNAVKYNEPANPNVVIHWAAPFDELPECDLKIEAYQSLGEYLCGRGEGFARAFERLPKPFRKVLPKPLPSTSRNQDQDQDQDQEQEQQQKPPPRPHALARTCVMPTSVEPGGTAAAAEIPTDEFAEGEMRETFGEVYFALRKAPANMHGNVSTLHADVIATARARGMSARTLFRTAVHRWASGELNNRERKHPYACFAAAWGDVVGETSKPTDPRSELARKSLDALRRGDMDAYNASERELGRLIEEQQSAQ